MLQLGFLSEHVSNSCQATIVLAILQTWFRDLEHEFQFAVLAFQVPISV